MADFAVSTAFTAADRVTRALGHMSKGAGKFGDRATRAFNKASRSGSRFGDIVKGVFTANIITSGLRMMVRSLADVGRGFISLDDAIVSAAAKFSDINLLTEVGRQRMDALRVSARAVGAATEFTATQAGQGLDFLALAGFNAAQAMASLNRTVDLATVGQVDLSRATDIASDALGAFGLMTKDSAQLQVNFARQNDVMALTMARTNTNIEDMFEAIKKGAPLFTQAGQSLETFNALVGILAGSGSKGSEAGTQLRNVILRLADATPAAQKAMDRLGIVTADSTGKFRDVVDILSDFEAALIDVESAQKLQILSTIFGARSVTGISILLKQGSKAVRDFRDELIDSSGAAEEMAAIMRTSLGNRLKALKSAAIEVGFKIFEAFRIRGSAAIVKFTDAVRNVNVQPLIDFLETMSGVVNNLADAFGPVVKTLLPAAVVVFTKLTEALKWLSPILPALVGAWIAYKTVAAAVTVAQIALNVAMTANPIGVIIMGIAALVAAGVLLYENWDVIKLHLLGAWAILKQEFAKVVNKIVSLFAHMAGVALKTARAVASFFGVSTVEIDAVLAGIDKIQDKVAEALPGGSVSVAPHAPNRTEIDTRHAMTFNGQLNIAGAPAGSTVDTKSTGGGQLRVTLAGVNP